MLFAKTLENIKIVNSIIDELNDKDREIQSERLGELLAYIPSIKEELEMAEKKAKTLLLERGIGKMMYPEVDRKVVLEDGKASTIYFARDIYKAMAKKELEDSFFDIVNIIIGKIADLPKGYQDEVKKIIAAHSTKEEGKPKSVISVRKLSKEDREELELKKVEK